MKIRSALCKAVTMLVTFVLLVETAGCGVATRSSEGDTARESTLDVYVGGRRIPFNGQVDTTGWNVSGFDGREGTLIAPNGSRVEMRGFGVESNRLVGEINVAGRWENVSFENFQALQSQHSGLAPQGWIPLVIIGAIVVLATIALCRTFDLAEQSACMARCDDGTERNCRYTSGGVSVSGGGNRDGGSASLQCGGGTCESEVCGK